MYLYISNVPLNLNNIFGNSKGVYIFLYKIKIIFIHLANIKIKFLSSYTASKLIL